MKIGDFEFTVVPVQGMPEDQARVMQLMNVELKSGKVVYTYKELARFVNIGQPVEE